MFEEVSQWRHFWFPLRAELVSSWLWVAEEELGMWCEGKRSFGEVNQMGGETEKETVEKN